MFAINHLLCNGEGRHSVQKFRLALIHVKGPSFSSSRVESSAHPECCRAHQTCSAPPRAQARKRPLWAHARARPRHGNEDQRPAHSKPTHLHVFQLGGEQRVQAGHHVGAFVRAGVAELRRGRVPLPEAPQARLLHRQCLPHGRRELYGLLRVRRRVRERRVQLLQRRLAVEPCLRLRTAAASTAALTRNHTGPKQSDAEAPFWLAASYPTHATSMQALAFMHTGTSRPQRRRMQLDNAPYGTTESNRRSNRRGTTESNRRGGVGTGRGTGIHAARHPCTEHLRASKHLAWLLCNHCPGKNTSRPNHDFSSETGPICLHGPCRAALATTLWHTMPCLCQAAYPWHRACKKNLSTTSPIPRAHGSGLLGNGPDHTLSTLTPPDPDAQPANACSSSPQPSRFLLVRTYVPCHTQQGPTDLNRHSTFQVCSHTHEQSRRQCHSCIHIQRRAAASLGRAAPTPGVTPHPRRPAGTRPGPPAPPGGCHACPEPSGRRRGPPRGWP